MRRAARTRVQPGELAGQGEPYASIFADRSRVRAAVEGVAAGAEDSVFGAQQVAIFPPGGVL